MAHEYHFSHHLAEAKRNTARLKIALMAIFVSTAGIVVPTVLTHAAADANHFYIDGVKILNSGTGNYGGTDTGPYASATAAIKRVSTGISSISAANPFYFTSVPGNANGESYILSVSPVTTGGYTVKGMTYCADACPNYLPQSTNFHAGSSVTVTLKLNHNYHMRWIYEPVPTPTPTPKPVATPTPKPVATPVPATPAPSTPKPSGAVTPAPTVKAGTTTTTTSSGSSATSSSSSSASKTTTTTSSGQKTQTVQAGQMTPAPVVPGTAPAAPGDFEALVDGSNALVALSWTASSDPSEIKGYLLERSIDQSSWTTIANGTQDVSFRDDTVVFAVHYYYRISAIGLTDLASPYATADAITGEFDANSVSSAAGNYLSDDKLVSIDVPAGAMDTDAVCTVELATDKLGTKDRPQVAGPYSLVCKDSGGSLVTDFSKPVTWSVALKNKLKGYKLPGAVSVDSSGNQTVVKDATYDSKTQTLHLNQSGATTVAVLATAVHGISLNIIALVVVIILVVIGVLLLVLRKTQRENYNDYIRSKYYNL